jgi:hypothetical protein
MTEDNEENHETPQLDWPVPDECPILIISHTWRSGAMSLSAVPLGILNEMKILKAFIGAEGQFERIWSRSDKSTARSSSNILQYHGEVPR